MPELQTATRGRDTLGVPEVSFATQKNGRPGEVGPELQTATQASSTDNRYSASREPTIIGDSGTSGPAPPPPPGPLPSWEDINRHQIGVLEAQGRLESAEFLRRTLFGGGT